MLTEQAPSIFESFNARALTPSQVARTFVPSHNFEQLTQRRHSLVIGPRGSGKTTLLKMLQPAALESWEHPAAESYSNRIEFSGIFVPFDRSWRAQLDALDSARSQDGDHSLLGVAAFTVHVYRGVVTSFLSRASSQRALRTHRRVQLKPSQQGEIASKLFEIWDLPSGAKSLLGVRASLGQRLSEIGALGKRLTSMKESGAREAVLANATWLYASFLDGITAALDVWESVLESGDERWGLLFDELELAPAEIKRTLFGSLRSRDARLIFKLALSPFDGELPTGSNPEDPQPGQDYDPIPLWYSEKRDTVPFCRQMWDAMLADRDLPPTSPKIAFGRSRFETPFEEWRNESPRTAYGPGTRLQRSFSQLEQVDPSFREFLLGKGYDSLRLDRVPPKGRPAELRKIGPLVAARLFFLRDQAQPRQRGRGISKTRSRKRLTLYTGWESLCAVSEGNPRWFIGLVKPLLDAAPKNRIKIKPSSQAVAIEATSSRYRATLRTIPVASAVARNKSTGLVSIVDSVGEYFRAHQIDAPFTPEPPGSFTVDADASRGLLQAVGQALNAGALVLVEGEDEIRGLESLRERRLRLCYLLVAHYGAMPRLGRTVLLSRILADRQFELRDPIQLSLG